MGRAIICRRINLIYGEMTRREIQVHFRWYETRRVCDNRKLDPNDPIQEMRPDRGGVNPGPHSGGWDAMPSGFSEKHRMLQIQQKQVWKKKIFLIGTGFSWTRPREAREPACACLSNWWIRNRNRNIPGIKSADTMTEIQTILYKHQMILYTDWPVLDGLKHRKPQVWNSQALITADDAQVDPSLNILVAQLRFHAAGSYFGTFPSWK